jgi:hypothetical protein
MQRGPTLEDILQLWRDLLPDTNISAESDLFAVGGTSLTAATLVVQAQRRWDVRLDLAAMLDAPTAGDFHASVLAAIREHQTIEPIAPLLPGTEPTPSFNQSIRLGMDEAADRAGRPRVTHNISFAYRASGSLSYERLRQALTLVATRHAPLRSVFPSPEAVRILPAPPIDCTVEEMPPGGHSSAARLESHATTRFEPHEHPPWSVLVLREDPTTHVVSCVFDHLVFDGGSIAVFLDELRQAYQTPAAIDASPVSPSYYDWAAWQRTVAAPTAFKYAAEHAYVDGGQRQFVPRLRLLVENDLGASQLGVAHRRLSADLVRPIDDAGRAQGATLFQSLLAAFTAALDAVRARGPFGVVTPITNRTRLDAANLVGWLSNPGLVTVHLEWSATFAEALSQTALAVRKAMATSVVPVRTIQQHLNNADAQSSAPIPRAHFSLDDEPPDQLTMGELILDRIDVADEPFLVPGFSVWARHHRNDAILLQAGYDAGSLPASAAEQVLEAMELVLRYSLDRPGEPLAAVRRALMHDTISHPVPVAPNR